MNRSKKKFIVYTDGGARGNPGPAAYGFVIYDVHKTKIYQEGKTIGNTTNNVAEYSAVIAAAEWLRNSNYPEIESIEFYLDSELVASQLSGTYKVKNPTLKLLHEHLTQLLKTVSNSVQFHAIRREYNKEADALVNLALDAKV